MRWIDLSVVFKINMLRFWNKLIDLSNEILTKKHFLKDYFCKKNWSYEIKLIAEEINQLDFFYSTRKN